MTYPFNIPVPLTELVDRLEKNGYSAYFVGGCVRDALLGNKPQDYDIACSARPEEVAKLFCDCTVIPTGIKHGTVTVLNKGYCAEVTTYRKDGAYTDFRRPDNVVFSNSIEDDTSRRDFTVNALCYNPRTGILDFHGGLEDLKRGIIRCVGNPKERFGEDALRILRALRFAARLGFSIEKNTAFAVLDQRELIKNIAVERVLSELKGFFSAKGSVLLARSFMPVISTALGVSCPAEQEFVLNGLSTLEASYRLPYFIACLGKDVEGAKGIIMRLNPDTKTALQVACAAEAMYGVCFETAAATAYTARKHGLQNARLMYAVSSVQKRKICSEAEGHLNSLEKGELPVTLNELAINGNDIKALGVTHGKSIGEILENLYRLVQEGLPNTREALTAKAIMFINGVKP